MTNPLDESAEAATRWVEHTPDATLRACGLVNAYRLGWMDGAGRFPTSRRATHTVGRTQGNGGPMARIEETFDDRDWYMIECDDPDCEQRFDDGQWYADEYDLLADAKDDGWQILYRDEHPELERDMHYCPAHRLPECSTCTNIMIDPAGWKDGQCPECIKEEIPNERS